MALYQQYDIDELNFENIARGDIVKLKSGGPKMTISGFYVHQNQVYCDWFDGGTRHKSTFSIHVLEYAVDADLGFRKQALEEC